MTEGIRLKCSREGCRHEWTYKGDSKFYATCPSCKTNIKINECKVKKE